MRAASPRVRFLVAGAQKCGTTALHRFLSAHPGLFLPAGKELHFFDRPLPDDWSGPEGPLYETAFAQARPDQLCGEATPVYLFHTPSLQRIRAYNPAMRLILLLRDPVLRAYSHWRMERTRGAETLPFPEAIRAGRARVAEDWRTFSYVERGFYGAQLTELERLFPREQRLVLWTDEMQRDHAGTLARIWRFLGCAAPPVPPPPAEIRPLDPAPGLAPLAEEDARYLRSLYAPDIALTEALTGRDLSLWREGALSPPSSGR
ncbi:sulfotransferase [Rhodobacter sphaeroides]|jgi:Sulfotransferase domain.|uniref:Deacetylase sulfotransferase n=1 Tax=Cereibacter sphaeroides (strain ATCC 17023 / DSM 158 / JCM 6121 / CCUG 31486 / LMG 2827 / NBRC 12203 / NCIMB 8253 / ATH 2.4.1.) TaxID=272943 RepID=Q3HKN9_CERS4|nr:sulfotransferase [Cereibacter sphaeroides]ABA81705.1 putative deacetylase sulfotransferase [Cereibacter sphaeroides 2.4.1]AMJ49885.1 sulfotransferase [Cereibacter sphaeroides]ANS36665.1 sulfotransferase [Cereibacter sphaeroides]ATN65661.1 sulfotransferase [Cereibacter sphaeroides]AXC63802.1 sulfotransferase [Cereibacter sphaeroides 2.4.1]